MSRTEVNTVKSSFEYSLVSVNFDGINNIPFFSQLLNMLHNFRNQNINFLNSSSLNETTLASERLVCFNLQLED